MNRTFEFLPERFADLPGAGKHGPLVKMWTRGVPIEEGAARQLANTAALPFIYKWLAVMPDVHFGKGSIGHNRPYSKGPPVPWAAFCSS